MNTSNNSNSLTYGYADIGELQMYYQIHGDGEPLLLLHGGITTIDTSFGQIIPALAESRQVIAVEQQAHGHTADIDRELTFENMAADTAALLKHLGISQADVFGYSDGGNVGLGLAIQHPQTVRKLVIAGTNYNLDGMNPEFLKMMANATPEDIPGPMRESYEKVAPRPGDWPVLVEKVRKLGTEFQGWSKEEISAISAPTLVVTGDSDIVRLEHSLELFRLLSQGNLAVLPMTHHGMRLHQPSWLIPILDEFLSLPGTAEQ